MNKNYPSRWPNCRIPAGSQGGDRTPDQPLAGLAVQELDRETAQELGLKGKKGVVVTNVDPESEAERAGLMPGDVIREINPSR